MSSNKQYSGNALLELRDVHVAYPSRRRGGAVDVGSAVAEGGGVLLGSGVALAVGTSVAVRVALGRGVAGLVGVGPGGK